MAQQQGYTHSLIATIKDRRWFTAVFILTLSYQLLGMFLGYFGPSHSYDKLVHFLLPASVAPLLYDWLVRTKIFTSQKAAGALVSIVSLGVTAEVLWEIFEFTLDEFTGINWQYSLQGTMLDIIMAVAGALIGGAVYVLSRR